jgi:hypothetical protein
MVTLMQVSYREGVPRTRVRRRQLRQSTDFGSVVSIDSAAGSILSVNRTAFVHGQRALGTNRPSKPRKYAASAISCVLV